MALLGGEGRQWLVLRAQKTFKCDCILKIPISVLCPESHSVSFTSLGIDGSARVQEQSQSQGSSVTECSPNTPKALGSVPNYSKRENRIRRN